MKFTDRYLQSIKPPEKEYCIREGHGFTLRVLPSGLKVFQYVFTLKGKRHRLNLGHYPVVSLAEAREKYHVAFLKVSKGVNPQDHMVAVEPESSLTVSHLVAKYKLFCKEQKLENSTIQETVRTLDKYVIPFWGNRNIQDIRRRDAIDLIEPLAATVPGQARGVMKITRAMFNYALKREMLDFNPFVYVPDAIPSVKSSSTERVLDDAEIMTIWKILYSKDAPGTSVARRALLLVLVTAQRPGEVAGMAWDEIEGNWWTIPVERIKTRKSRKEVHRVFLTPLALSLIGENPGYSPYVFLGASPTSPISRHALSHLVCKETEGGRPTVEGKKSAAREKYFGLPRWTPHDLRRTAATKLSELDCVDGIIDSILNHGKTGVIGIYNRYKYDKQKQEWLTKWAEHLEELVGFS